jgi:hypothetical protein
MNSNSSEKIQKYETSNLDLDVNKIDTNQSNSDASIKSKDIETNSNKIQSKEKLEMLWPGVKNLYGKVKRQILKCFALHDYRTIETFFDLIDYTDLKRLFDEVGSDIIFLALIVRNSLSINFIADKVPKEITKSILRKDDFKIVIDYINSIGRLDEVGMLNSFRKKLSHEIFEALLRIDKEGISDLVLGNEENQKLRHMTLYVKETIKSLHKNICS